jgi:tetratricopeptide (TPR) repeat protein
MLPLKLAHAISQAGDMTRARETFDSALAMDPTHVEATYNRGLLLSDMRDYAGASAAFAAALLLEPRHVDSMRQLGLCELDRGRVSEAAQALRAAVTMSPRDLGAVHGVERARVLMQQQAADAQGVRFITFASDLHRCGLRRLQRSATHHGVTLDVVAPPIGTAWLNGLKLELLRARLLDLPAAQLACVVDGYDVMLAGSAEQLMRRYERLIDRHNENDVHDVERGGGNDGGDDVSGGGERGRDSNDSARRARARTKRIARIVFSADQTFYFVGPNENGYAEQYPRSPTIYRFLNSGSFIGPSADLISLIDAVTARYASEWNFVSDQTLFHRHLIDGRAEPQPDLGGDADGDADARGPALLLDYHQARNRSRDFSPPAPSRPHHALSTETSSNLMGRPHAHTHGTRCSSYWMLSEYTTSSLRFTCPPPRHTPECRNADRSYLGTREVVSFKAILTWSAGGCTTG